MDVLSFADALPFVDALHFCRSPAPGAMGHGLRGLIAAGEPRLHARVYTDIDQQIKSQGWPKQGCRFVGVAAMDGRWGLAAATLLPLKKQNQLLFFESDEFKQKSREKQAQGKLARCLLNEFAPLLWPLATEPLTTLQRKS
ncbi:hypothetical protein [Limnohabitans sp. WS1]|uniref:hypothetical protein n=1 Tax=Limnohabitans sp. WS1 TaxID=1100726 RepID=UPI0011B26485|nr:hypothetical protein [Limnohabitans sp. WS1]